LIKEAPLFLDITLDYRGEDDIAQMSGNLSYFPFSRGLFCLPINVNPEECFAYRVCDASLLSHSLAPGMFAIVRPIKADEMFAAGELLTASVGGLHVIKRVFVDNLGRYLLDDDFAKLGPFEPLEVRIEARVMHACTGQPETCNGWMRTIEWQQGLYRIAS
jgi:hypothetical protein